MDDDITEEDEASLRSLVFQTIAFTVVLVAGVAFAGIYFREPITQFAHWLIKDLGVWGLLFGIIISDAFTFPVPPDTYLLIVVASGGKVAKILAIVCAGSILAGSIAYRVGPFLTKIGFFNRRIERFRRRGEILYQKYGIWTVVIAALTPIPFSVVCWFAGIYGMPYRKFFFATFARVPRLVGYYLLFELGWA